MKRSLAIQQVFTECPTLDSVQILFNSPSPSDLGWMTGALACLCVRAPTNTHPAWDPPLWAQKSQKNKITVLWRPFCLVKGLALPAQDRKPVAHRPSSQGHSRGLSNSFQKFRSHKEGWFNRSLLIMHLAGIIPRVLGVTQRGHKVACWCIKNRLLGHVNGCIFVTFPIWPLLRSAWTEFWPIKMQWGRALLSN